MCVKLPSRLSRYKREHASTISSMAPLLAALGPICCIKYFKHRNAKGVVYSGIRIAIKFNVFSKISYKRKKYL